MSKVQRLRKELSSNLNSGSIVESDLLKLREKVGSLVIKALDDDQHPLAAQLKELTAVINQHRVISPARLSATTSDHPKKVEMSDAHFFMPHPGISLPVRRFWPLQLLLHETARSPSREALAVRLEIDPEMITQHVRRAEEFSTGTWSMQQHGTLLLEAMVHLDDPEWPLRLEAKMLYYGGEKIRLSKQQATAVQLLIDNLGKWVEHEQFHQRGIRNPVRIFHALSKKATAKGITLPILPRVGAYTLADIA